jgi:hypothetical protein
MNGEAPSLRRRPASGRSINLIFAAQIRTCGLGATIASHAA